MINLITWVKNNKLVTVLVVVIIYLLFKSSVPSISTRTNTFSTASNRMEMSSMDMVAEKVGGIVVPPVQNAAPRPEVDDRKVVTTSNVSAVVENVRQAVNTIANEVESRNGYVLNKFVNTPEISETGSISVRIPSEQIDDFLASIRNLAVKVVYENITANDVTDQYVDIQERLNILNSNKARFEEIMDSATNVDEILRVQQQIFNLQDQIDRLKGQLQYLDGTSSTSLVTISLSTDEISLPYTPESPFRPQVILKEAVRALIIDLRWFATWLIWIGVYAVIWVPLGILGVVLYKVYNSKLKTDPPRTERM